MLAWILALAVRVEERSVLEPSHFLALAEELKMRSNDVVARFRWAWVSMGHMCAWQLFRGVAQGCEIDRPALACVSELVGLSQMCFGWQRAGGSHGGRASLIALGGSVRGCMFGARSSSCRPALPLRSLKPHYASSHARMHMRACPRAWVHTRSL